MAVAHDAASESHTGTTGSTSEPSFSWTHTPVGTPRGVVVFVFNANSNAVDVTSVTYGGVSMTAVAGGEARDTSIEPGSCKAFFLGASIPTGAQTVVVNRNNNANIMYAGAATVTASSDTSISGTPVLLQEDTVLNEQNVNTGATTALRYAGAYNGGSFLISTGANSTSLVGIDLGSFTIGVVRETTAGSGSRPVGFGQVGTDDAAAVHLAIAEAAGIAYTKSLTAALTFSGGISRRSKKPLASNITPSGALVKKARRSLAATLTPAGAITKRTSRSLVGSLSFNGAVARVTSRAFGATIALSGTLTKSTARALAGDLTFTGALNASRRFIKVFMASLTFDGSLAKRTSKSLTATLALTGALSRAMTRALSATVAFTPVLTKRTSRSFASAVTFTSSLARVVTEFVGAVNNYVLRSARRSGPFLRTGVSFVLRTARSLRRLR